jgi:Sap-like sulfolipid-1-addressing protein
MSHVLFFAFTAALNPTLLAATTVMLLLPRPKLLLLGYLLGAAVTSIALGIVIVFSLQDSGAVSTAKNTINPATDLAIGALLVVLACVLGTGQDQRLAERRRRRKGPKPEKGPPRWQQALSKGSARTTFIVGALLTLPGASYLAGLDRIAKEDFSTAETVGVVILFNLIMLALIELPLIGYALAPDWTPKAVAGFKDGLSRHGRAWGVRGAAIVGTLLIVRGIITLLV